MAKKLGRPQTVIDWDNVAKLISYGNTARQISHFYNISLDTFERAAIRDLNMTFAEFCQRHKDVGKIRLKMSIIDHIESGRMGWANAAKYVMDKMNLWGEPDDDSPKDDGFIHPKRLLSFKEFCVKADYFEPFDKQVEMMNFGMSLTETRLLLGSRGYGKTDYITILGVAYDLYKAYMEQKTLSDHTNLIITKSKTRNNSICEEIKNALEKNGVPLDKANGSVIRVKGLVGKDHSVEAITIKTSMRGRHPKRIVMDDPVTDEDVSSAMRDTVKRKYDEAYKLCSNILIIGQPAHFDDLYAGLRGSVKTLEVPFGSIPELDPDLEAMKIAGVDEVSISMSYFLKVPEDGQSIFANLKYIDRLPEGDAVAFLDPSDGGDYTALTIFRGYFSGMAIKGKAYKKSWFHIIDDLVEVLKAHSVVRLAVETNKHGDTVVEILRAAFAEAGLKCGVVGFYSETNKHADISNAGAYAHRLHLSKDSDREYTKQVTKYDDKAKHDDAPDSLARGLIWLGLVTGKKIKRK